MKRILLLMGMLCMLSMQVVAQTATLKGKVLDQNQSPIIGANIKINELNGVGTVSGTDGNFEIGSLRSGKVTVMVAYLGYQSVSSEVTLTNGQTSDIEVILSESEVLLEGAVVTAQRREQEIQKVPIAVTTYDRKFFSDLNIREVDALSEFVPGLQVQLQSPNNPGFVIRGITSDNGDSRVEPRVSVFQDGVSISKSRGSVVEVFDMERVEVLKGPQGTLFGRGAQIGAVHFIQNKAQRDFGGELTLGYGNLNQQLVSGHINTPITDNLFVRVAGQYNARDGFRENQAGGELNGKETGTLRGALRWLPSGKTIVDLIYNWQKDSYPGTAFQSGTVAPPGTMPGAFGPANLERGESLFIDRSLWSSTLLVDHLLSNRWRLNSVTAFREFDSFESFDADGSSLPALWFAEDAYGRQFSQEFRFTYNNESKFAGFVGASYFHEEGSQRVPFETNENSFFALLSPVLNAATQGAIPVLPFYNADGTPFLGAGQALGIPLKDFHSESYQNFGKVNAFEVFADGTYQLSPKLSLTLGLRATLENVQNGYRADFEGDPSVAGSVLDGVFGASPNLLFQPTNGVREAEGEFLSAVGRFVLAYEVSDNLNTYANISRGRRPNVIQVTAEDVQELNAETVWSYEIGLKGQTNRLSYDLAAYYYDYANFQVSVITTEGGTFQAITRDEGNATAMGFETSLRYAFGRNITAFGTYSYIDATFDDTDADGNEQELAGNRFRLTPKNTFSLGLNAEFNVGRGVFFIRPTYSYKSSVFFEEQNQPEIEQDGYGLLNARMGYQFAQRKYEIALYGSNLLDEVYLIDAGNTGNAFGTPTFIAGAPRLFGLQLTGRF